MRNVSPAARLAAALMVCLAGAGAVLVAAGPPPKPSTPPLPGGKLTIGGGAGGNAPAADPTATEAQAVASTGLAPATGPAPLPATSPATAPYADVSFARRSSTRPAPVPKPVPAGPVTDAEVERSIRAAIEVLAAQFDAGSGLLRNRRFAPQYEALECGLDSLCVYALLQAGSAVGDKRLGEKAPVVQKMLDGTKRFRADQGVHQTYARAIRATALAVFNRREDHAQLREDVGCLAGGHVEGGYGYLTAYPRGSGFQPQSGGPAGFPKDWIDHSNSQYGLLGVWSGAEVGVEVPDGYWKTVFDYWSARQSAGGRWAYRSTSLAPGKGESLRPPEHLTTLSMTAAGTASLFVAGERAEEAAGGFRVGRDPFSEPLQRSLAWWEQGDHAVNLGRGAKHWGYTLYGVERVGLASGFKFFGDHDWFRVLARQVIDRQQPDGSWGDLVDTSYALIFLSRGRHPILMNKLRFDGKDAVQPDYWANRPNDLSHLARFAARQLERPLNWQVVPLRKDWSDWLDAPVLYIASHKRPRFGPAEVDKLRRYAESGGLIFTHADQDDAPTDPLQALADPPQRSDEFDRFVVDLAGKLFPDHKLADLPADYPLLSSLYKLGANKPLKLRAVSNGSRLLLVHSSQDVAGAWQGRDEEKGRAAFELGLNLFVYAAGKKDLRNRLDPPAFPPPPAGPAAAGRVLVARLQYAGNWSPEPRAWERFASVFQWKTGTAVDVRTIAWRDLKPAAAAVAHVTGTARYAPTPAELAAAKAFVEAGGVLLVDECGGHGGGWARGLEAALATAFPAATKTDLTPDHPLLAGGEPGMADGLKLRLRPYATEVPAARPAIPTAIAGKPSDVRVWRAGRGAVVFCPIDLTTGILGTNTWAIRGYDPASAEALVRNVVFWAMDGVK